MPATLASQRVVITGLESTSAPATADGDTMRCSLGAFLYVENGDVDPHTVTINDPDPDGTDVDVVVEAGDAALIGPISNRFRDRNDGFAHITYDDVTDVDVTAIVCPTGRLPGHVTGSALTTQHVTLDGLVPDYTAAGASQKIKPGLRTFLHVRNGDGSSHSATLDDPTSVSPVGAKQFDPDVQVTVTNGENRWIGPIDGRFADPDDTNLADIAWSATTSMSIAVLAI